MTRPSVLFDGHPAFDPLAAPPRGPRVPRVVLSRRNLLALLSKLDRVAAGERSACEIGKSPDPAMPREWQQTMKYIRVIALPDDVAYANRAPGELLAVDVAAPPASRCRLTEAELREKIEAIQGFGPAEITAGDIVGALRELLAWREGV